RRSSGPAGLEDGDRPPVRLLPAGADDAGGRAAPREAGAHRRRHRRCDAGQHLPLRDVSADPRGHQARRRSHMTSVVLVTRRGFLGTVLSAGALVLCARVLPARALQAATRKDGATARLMLVRAAAVKWNVPPSECTARDHQVVHTATGRSLGYGELATLAAAQPVPKPEELQLKSPAEFRYVGTDVAIIDLEEICTGKAVYGIDAQMPGMVYASIARSPVLGGTLESYDDTEARKVRGVQQTVVLPPAKPPYAFQALGGVAVVADGAWAALQRRE